MKQKLTPIAIGLCLLGIMSVPAYAVDSNSTEARTQALEQQLAELKQEVAALKSSHKSSTHHARKAAAKHQSPDKSDVFSGDTTTSGEPIKKLISTAELGELKADKQSSNINGPQYLPESGIQYLPVDFDVPGQSFVSTGPYIGVPLQYAGNDLIINSPSVNNDVLLLSLRKNINKRLMALGFKPEDLHSHLLLSGTVEGQVLFKNANTGTGSTNSSDIDLTSAGIDAYILTPSTWVSGLISLNYSNNTGTSEGSLNNNSRSQNSRVFVNKAFIVVGDFLRSPFYGTLGQMYVPFGVYSTSLVSSPLTKLLARTQQRAILVGMQQQSPNAFYGSVYGFKGDSHLGVSGRINNGGINAGYKFDAGCVTGRFGGGVIANIADSQGMQNTGNQALTSTFGTPATFGGFGGSQGTGNETLVHRVPAYDFNMLLSFGKSLDFLAEVVTASTSFHPNDMTFKSHAAKPMALDLEGAYTFQGISQPTSVTLGYGMTKQAAALGLAAQRWSAVLNTSFWRNTLQALEFRHDYNYALSAYSTGSTIPGPVVTDRSDNMVTLQFDIYF